MPGEVTSESSRQEQWAVVGVGGGRGRMLVMMVKLIIQHHREEPNSRRGPHPGTLIKVVPSVERSAECSTAESLRC